MRWLSILSKILIICFLSIFAEQYVTVEGKSDSDSDSGSISGQVITDPEGEPIEGVEVAAWSEDLYFINKKGITDLNGNYTITSLAPGNYYVSTGNDLGYVDEWYDNLWNYNNATLIHVNASQDTSNINFALTIGGSISGTVTSESNGQPIQWLEVYTQDGVIGWGTNTHTDSKGNYTISGIPRGDYIVRASGQGYATEYYNNIISWIFADLIHIDPPNHIQNINFTMELGGNIIGRVTSEEEPLNDVKINVYDINFQVIAYSYTWSNGEYAFEGLENLPIGSYYISTENNQGYIDEWYDNATQQSNATPINVSASEDATVNFILVKAPDISTSTTITTTVPSSTTTSTTKSTSTTISTEPCLVETVFGESSKDVELLRFFREEVLNKSPEGQEIIKLYYEWSPTIVKAMEEDETFKEQVKEMIDVSLKLIKVEDN